MPARDLLVVLLRLVGLYLIVFHAAQIPIYLGWGYSSVAAYNYLSSTGSWFGSDGMDGKLVGDLVGFMRPFVLLGVGILLLAIAPRLALRFYPAAGIPEPSKLTLDRSTLLAVGLRILGVLLLVWAVEPLLRVVSEICSLGPVDTIDSRFRPGNPFLNALGKAAGYLILGAVLVIRADAMAGWFQRRESLPVPAEHSGEGSDPS